MWSNIMKTLFHTTARVDNLTIFILLCFEIGINNNLTPFLEADLRKKIFINPRLTKLIFETGLTNGRLLQPPMNLKNKRLMYAHLVPWFRYGSLLSIHTKTKKVQTSYVWRHNDVLCPNCRFTVKYRPQLNFSPNKF